MTPKATIHRSINDDERDTIRGIVETAAKVISSSNPAIQKLAPYAAQIIRVGLLELRRDDRAVKAAASKTSSVKK